MKSITFSCRHDRGTTTISEDFDEDCTWKAIAYSFRKFLAAQGYVIDPDTDLGDCILDYVDSDPSKEKLW